MLTGDCGKLLGECKLTENTTPFKPPCAFLFSSGQALYFDSKGDQIPRMQKHGLTGIHKFVVEFPDAMVFWGVVGGPATEMKEDELAKVISQIKEPKQKVTINSNLANCWEGPLDPPEVNS